MCSLSTLVTGVPIHLLDHLHMSQYLIHNKNFGLHFPKYIHKWSTPKKEQMALFNSSVEFPNLVCNWLE